MAECLSPVFLYFIFHFMWAFHNCTVVHTKLDSLKQILCILHDFCSHLANNQDTVLTLLKSFAPTGQKLFLTSYI